MLQHIHSDTYLFLSHMKCVGAIFVILDYPTACMTSQLSSYNSYILKCEDTTPKYHTS